MRKPIVAGNWKMNKTRAETTALIAGIKAEVAGIATAEIVVGVPFTDLDVAGQAIKGSVIQLAAQNVHWAEKGAFTGEISAAMLKELGVTYVIIGHSERRQYFGETDETVNKRTKAALAAGLKPIVCVGELLAEREAGTTTQVVERQVRAGLAGLQGADWEKIVIAYEPVWAIGTGKTATTAQAQEVHAFIRKQLVTLAGAEAAAKIRIQYGGSMKPDNAKDLMSQPDIDGGLIGGASLEAKSFADIVRGAQR